MSFVCNKGVNTKTRIHTSIIIIHCTNYLSSHWLKAYSFFWEITATYRLISYLLADNWLISITIMSIQVPCDRVFLVIFFKAMYNKTIIIDSVFVISGIIILFLDCLGDHKNRIYNNSFIIHCFEENNEKHTVARNLNWHNCYWN